MRFIRRGEQAHAIVQPDNSGGNPMTANEQNLIDKIKQLSQQRLAEVEDFVDFLRAREDDRRLALAAAGASAASFAAVWDNDEDAAYDRM
jgi:hypothetical protein